MAKQPGNGTGVKAGREAPGKPGIGGHLAVRVPLVGRGTGLGGGGWPCIVSFPPSHNLNTKNPYTQRYQPFTQSGAGMPYRKWVRKYGKKVKK
jgi:hypothetical protein